MYTSHSLDYTTKVFMALSITYSSELYNVVTFVKNVSFYQVKSIMLYNAHTTQLTEKKNEIYSKCHSIA